MAFHKVQRTLTIDYKSILDELARISIEKLQILDERNPGRPMTPAVVVETSMVSIGFGRQSGQTEEVIKYAIENKYCIVGSRHTMERFNAYTRGNPGAIILPTSNSDTSRDLEKLRGKVFKGIIIDNSQGLSESVVKAQIIALMNGCNFENKNLIPIIKVGN